MEDPVVVAIMITGKHAARIPFAQASKTAFQQQTYEKKQLVILNTGQERMTDEVNPEHGVYELHLPSAAHLTLGRLRNDALDIVQHRFGSAVWVIQWDDDDWHHPKRITNQVATAWANAYEVPVTLRNQIRYCFRTNNAYAHRGAEPTQGIQGTVLHPMTTHRYEEVPQHEDSRFLKLFPRIAICENDPSLYVRFAHSNNTFSERHIMGAMAVRPHQAWRLGTEERQYLQQLLSEQYSFCGVGHES